MILSGELMGELMLGIWVDDTTGICLEDYVNTSAVFTAGNWL